MCVAAVRGCRARFVGFLHVPGQANVASLGLSRLLASVWEEWGGGRIRVVRGRAVGRRVSVAVVGGCRARVVGFLHASGQANVVSVGAGGSWAASCEESDMVDEFHAFLLLSELSEASFTRKRKCSFEAHIAYSILSVADWTHRSVHVPSRAP